MMQLLHISASFFDNKQCLQGLRQRQSCSSSFIFENRTLVLTKHINLLHFSLSLINVVPKEIQSIEKQFTYSGKVIF